MRRYALLFIAASVLGLSASLTYGWGPAGHKIVASIAFRRLTVEEQQIIVDLLRQHPRFSEDFQDRMPSGVDENEWIFQQAAIWPDLAKGLPAGPKQQFSRPAWHFIDLAV